MMCFGLKDRKRAKTNHCVIVLLDDTQLVHELHASSTGQDLLDVVIKHLNLLETSYFGLKYLDTSRFQGVNNERSESRLIEQVWLDVNKSALKQLRHVQPMTVYFCVKYYAADPCKLAEEITRYQFFLQCKQDILHSRLPISLDLAVELFALAVQSELGDFDPSRHREGYVSEFQFLAANQTPELEQQVAVWHRSLAGQVPATAELNFLERIKWLDLYGCELHPIQYEDNGEEYALGLSPTGVLVLRNRLRVAHYRWPSIVKTKCQGRCFLMDVLELAAPQQQQSASSKQKQQQQPTRNRFGFRLADKHASLRLRWAIDEHKSFHQLIHNSASLSQLAQSHQTSLQRHHLQQQQLHQQQQLKLSQKLRNSIRSAISVGAFSQSQSHLSQQQQYLAHQQRLRASMKSLNMLEPGGQQRAPPSVVRMPSRRYRAGGQLPSGLQLAANGNGLPQMAHTMVDGQRQQALMMMSQLSRMNNLLPPNKAHTLKPMSASKDPRRNPYYQHQQQMVANQLNQDIAYLPAGQHIVQPTIYKAASVVNGLNQLANVHQQQHQMANPKLMQQFFNTNPTSGINNNYLGQAGHESPRSTKSAIAPSSALKLAAKKLAKQQLLYANQQVQANDIEPLLSANNNGNNYEQLDVNAGHLLFGMQQPPSLQMPINYKANQSPRSVRSARMAQNTRLKSKSTNENLHLLHNHEANKMLLAAAANNQLIMPPGPPNYAGQVHSVATKKRTTFALNNDQANHLLMTRLNRALPDGLALSNDQDQEDYYCSRSDCSSVQERPETNRRRVKNKSSSSDNNNNNNGSQQRRKSNHEAGNKQLSNQSQHDWNAIKRRHNEFSSGKGYLATNDANNPYTNREALDDDPNNNNNHSSTNSSLVKNIANKQATPILLSMNYDQSNANSKAVQLLNLQRQQLNSQTGSNAQLVSTDQNSGAISQSSSVTSSPQSANGSGGGGVGNICQSAIKASGKISDSAASSSTTSGYYAGSNSTGSASLDGDSHTTAEVSPNFKSGRPNICHAGEHEVSTWQAPEEMGSRAKIALASYGLRMVSTGHNRHGQANKEQQLQSQSKPAVEHKQQPQQRFYLGEHTNNSLMNGPSSAQRGTSVSPDDTDSQWSPLNQIQQHQPSSLKYVSFDV